MDLELNIQELRLHGFKSSDREMMAEALKAELERLFSQEGIPRGLDKEGTIRLEGGSFSLPGGVKAEEGGKIVARQMYERWR